MKWIFLFLSSSLFGSYIGNLADPAIMQSGLFSGASFLKFTSGYVYDYTNNKRMVSGEEFLKDFGLHSQLAEISLIFLQRFQVSFAAGGTKEQIKQSSLYNWVLDLQSEYHFSWNIGCKLILLQLGQSFISAGFRYFQVPASNESYFKHLNQLNLNLTDTQTFSLDEWETSLALSSQIWFLTPYAGVNYLKSQLKAEIEYENEKKWGYFYGLTLSLTGRFHLNLEKRLRDEFGYTFSSVLVF